MEPEKLLAQGLHELRTDLKSFVETRYELLRAELSTSAKKVRSAGLLLGAAGVLGILGLILLSFCAAFAIGFAFAPFAGEVGLIWGFLITGSGAVVLAAIAGAAGKSRLKAEDIKPHRTLRVLQHDQETLKKGVQENDEPVRRRA